MIESEWLAVFAAVLKATRARVGLTQREAAEQSGRGSATVSRWESGHRRPGPWPTQRPQAITRMIVPHARDASR
jgi:DNA-binding transcriptional regulator YiaG